MKNLILILLILILLGCSSSDSTHLLESSRFITENFTDQGISELGSIMDFTDSLVIAKTQDENIAEALHQYFEFLASYDPKSEQYLAEVRDENSSFMKYVQQHKSQEIFDKIWTIEQGVDYPTGVLISETLGIYVDGRYVSFLNDYTKSNDILIDYHEGIIASGVIPPTMMFGLLTNHQRLDFSDPNIRLIATVHLICYLYHIAY